MVRKFYLVEIEIPSTKATQFRAWLLPHMEEMSSLPCFTGHQLSVLDQGYGTDGQTCFQAKYFFEQDQDFEDYLEKFAAGMRGQLPDELKSVAQFRRALGEERSL